MELGFFRPLFDHKGPWASVYLDTSRSTTDAAALQRLHRRSAADRLLELGVDPGTRQALLDRLAQESAAHAQEGRVVFAAHGETVLDLPLNRPPAAVGVTWSPLPRLAPLLELLCEDPLCLVAYIDRTGADLELRHAFGREPASRTQGPQWQDRGHRGVPADRGEWHYRHRMENHWNTTADLIAAELVRRWPDSGPRLLVLAGDPRERRAVLGRLPEPLRAATVETENGSRAAGASSRLLDLEIAQACKQYATEHLEGALGLFLAGRGRPGGHGLHRAAGGAVDGTAAEGMPAVVDAARSSQVAALLLRRAGADTRREVWVGPQPDQIAVQRSQVRALGVSSPEQAPADDALLRCVAAGDAEVLLVPDEVPVPVGGLGAVLRWSG